MNIQKLNPFKGPLAGAPWMLGAAVCFSLMAYFTRLSGEFLSLYEIVLYRCIPSIVFLGILMPIKGETLKTKLLGRQFVRGTVGATSMFMNFFSINSPGVSLGLATTLSYTHPIFFALLSFFWWKERIGLPVVLCILLGFAGVILVSHPTGSPNLLGIGSGLGAGFFAALAYANVRSLAAQGEPEWRTVFYFSLIGGLYALGGMIVEGLPFRPLDWKGLELMAGMGATGLIGQLFITRSFGSGEANVTSMFSYSTLIFSGIWGAAFLGEAPDFISIGGMVVIAVSGMMMTWLKKPASSS